MKKYLLILSIGFLILGTSCSNNGNEDIFIKVKNTSLNNFTNVVFEMNPNNITNYGNISSGESTDYKTFDFASNMPNVALEINGEPYQILYNDDTGYNEFKSGFYTFNISTVNIGNDKIALYFEIISD
jgi:hypothetical protein